MLWIFLIVLFLILSWPFAVWKTSQRKQRLEDKTNRTNERSYTYGYDLPGGTEDFAFGAKIACWVLAAAAFLVLFIVIVVTFTTQVDDLTTIDNTFRVERIMGRRADELGTQAKTILVTQYPQYEQKTINNIVDKSPQLILLQFPDLKASATMQDYVARLTSLRDKVYDQQVKRSDIRKNIRARERNWLVNIPALLPH